MTPHETRRRIRMSWASVEPFPKLFQGITSALWGITGCRAGRQGGVKWRAAWGKRALAKARPTRQARRGTGSGKFGAWGDHEFGGENADRGCCTGRRGRCRLRTDRTVDRTDRGGRSAVPRDLQSDVLLERRARLRARR